MTRLVNTMKQGKYEWRAVLDSKSDCNYLEKTTGVYYQYSSGDHACLKCHDLACWMHWNKADTKATNTCNCGAKHTLEIIAFKQVALDTREIRRDIKNNCN